eukprot:6857702-Prymnesium_polylepis.1
MAVLWTKPPTREDGAPPEHGVGGGGALADAAAVADAAGDMSRALVVAGGANAPVPLALPGMMAPPAAPAPPAPPPPPKLS